MEKWKKIRLVLIILIGYCVRISAQENNQVRGILCGENAQPLPFANVLLLNPVDSSFLYGGVTSEKGVFSFSIQRVGDLLLKASFVGYEDFFYPIKILEGKNDLGNLVLQEGKMLLRGVTIVAQRPTITMKDGNIVTEVQNTSLSMLGTAQDVMRYVPGVIKLGDELQVSGKGNPNIYVDGHKLQDISELDRISSNDIKSVEVVLNPGVKYDAQSRAVLDIRTNKKEQTGLYVYSMGRLETGHYLRNREMVNLGYSSGKFDWYLSYNHFFSDQKRIKQETQRKEVRDTIVVQREYSPNRETSESHSLTGSFNYMINPRVFIGAKYIYVKSRNDWRVDGGSFNMLVNEESLPVLWTNNRSKANTRMHQVNAFYQGSFNDFFRIQADLDYMDRNYSNVAWIEETEGDGEIHTDLLRDRRNRLLAGRLDLSYDFKAGGKINWGAEYSHVETSGNSNLVGQVENGFLNTEKKIAAFMAYKVQWDKLSIEGGIRYENVLAYAFSNGVELSNKYYSELYPSLSLLYPFRNVSFSLDFSRRVRRPSFGQLSNELVYYNQYYWYYGNPDINPQTIYGIGSGLHYRFLTFRMNYQYIKNFIVEDFSVDPSNALVTIEQPFNYPDYHVLGLTVTVEQNIGCWKGILNGSLYKPFFSVDHNGQSFLYNKPYADVSLNNQFFLPRDYTIRLDGYLYSGGSRDNKNHKVRESIDIAVSKAFLKKSLVLTLRAEDLFHGMNTQTYSAMNGLSMDKKVERDSRIVMLTLTWMFNKLKSGYKGVGAAKEELYR
ncbi:TonB-dependent receptor [Parabacteroides sp.]